MTWYINDLKRWKDEREGLEALAQEADWFRPVGWRMDESFRLVLDADIAAGSRIYPVFLRYPGQFPFSPPSVYPRGEEEDVRWSDHQFGAGGELCLELGPDNWTPDMTGAQMIQSAHRLLDGENPVTGERGAVPSRHVTTLGQRLRSEFSHLLITNALNDFLISVPVGVPYTGNVLAGLHKEVIVDIIDKVARPDGTTWTDPSVPAHISYELRKSPITIFRVPNDAVYATDKGTELKAALEGFGLKLEHSHILILRGAQIREFYLSTSSDTTIESGIVPAQPEERRLDEGHDALKGKRVALIGCGSLGSKLGTMLARSGVASFLLVDEDILLPENLVRNDLDWHEIGTHKADGLSRRMQLVNPAVHAEVRRIRLAGQESSATAETILKSIGECDLILDATASPDVLNLLSAFAAATKKPMIWAEIFGGGIGGLIARSRPGLDPPPQYMRRAIENWFAENGPPPVRSIRRYETGEAGPPLIADDADVSVIAGHAARLAIDLLSGRDPSLFPNSAYAIGLAPGSVFTQPFETYPIASGDIPPTDEERAQLGPDEAAAELAKIVALFKPDKK